MKSKTSPRRALKPTAGIFNLETIAARATTVAGICTTASASARDSRQPRCMKVRKGVALRGRAREARGKKRAAVICGGG